MYPPPEGDMAPPPDATAPPPEGGTYPPPEGDMAPPPEDQKRDSDNQERSENVETNKLFNGQTIDDLSFVAEVDGEVQGFLLARRAYFGEPFDEVGMIHILGVEPDYWRRGVATQMVNALVETCQEKKLNAVRIMLDQKDDQLQGLFERLGFRRGRLVDYTKKFKKVD